MFLQITCSFISEVWESGQTACTTTLNVNRRNYTVLKSSWLGTDN